MIEVRSRAHNLPGLNILTSALVQFVSKILKPHL